MTCHKLSTIKRTSLFCDVLEYSPFQCAGDTKLIGNLLMSLLYLLSKFGEDLIYWVQVTTPEEGAPGKVHPREMTDGHKNVRSPSRKFRNKLD